MDRALERRYRSPQNRRLANHVLLTAGFAPQLWVASFLTSGSADYTIVMIGLPDPKRIVLKPQSELHPLYICGTLSQAAAEGNPCVGRSLLIQFRFSFRRSCPGLALFSEWMTFWRGTTGGKLRVPARAKRIGLFSARITFWRGTRDTWGRNSLSRRCAQFQNFGKRFLERERLFVSQGNHRIDAHRATCGDVARQDRHRQQQ